MHSMPDDDRYQLKHGVKKIKKGSQQHLLSPILRYNVDCIVFAGSIKCLNPNVGYVT